MKPTFRKLPVLAAMVAASTMLAACQQSIPKEALDLKQVTVEKRQRQTRHFDTLEEEKLLSASAAVLQDLGFSLDESETDLGVIVGSKDRDATEAGQVVGAVVVAVLFGVATPIDDRQKIRVSLVTRPLPGDGERTAVRVTFQRIVWNTQNVVSRAEPLDDPELYQEFFDRLSQSVFLEAHEV
ncbi:hypothetical protein C882_4460 [Caenispirillum salinarum AK4]|uniref:Lipoprotein n=1 Tax=Caenispirillum salinarum AK4 TaxID=1238182 RepID=K9HPV7_9PROT|nr:hypothetical protein [Caenispirillum salinarum]EKV30501.1 hypothetical protein C882_4460 [Caenispirillum salinarum AK4]